MGHSTDFFSLFDLRRGWASFS